MAARYWVTGGTGNWNSTTNWSTSSGGASGASVPGTSDDAIFDTNSGAGNVIINVATANIISIDFTNFTGTLVVNQILNTRSITLGAGMSFDTTAGTPRLRMAGTCTYTSNAVTWPYRLELGGSAATTLTLNDNITVQNLNRISTSSFALTINNNTLTILGDFSFTSGGTGIASGTTSIILAGTGTWSQTGTGVWRNNLTINTAGTITISGNVRYNTGTLTYTAGTVVTTGSTLNIAASTTLDTNGISWDNISMSGVSVITLSSDLDINGNLLFAGAATLNNNAITVAGNLTVTSPSVTTGTATITLDGTGTWSSSSNGAIRNNLTINTAGTITISGNVRYNTGTLTYTAGTVVTTGSTLIAQTTTLDTNGISWDNISISSGNTLTLTSALTATGTMTLSTGLIFVTSGFTVDTLTVTAAGLTFQLVSTATHTINTNFICTAATSASRVLFRSTTPGSKAILNLSPGATPNLGFVNATDIDSSGGRTIYSYRGVFSNTDNWDLLPTDPAVTTSGETSFTFIN